MLSDISRFLVCEVAAYCSDFDMIMVTNDFDNATIVDKEAQIDVDKISIVFRGRLSVTQEPGFPESRGQNSRVPRGALPRDHLRKVRED